LDQLPSLLAQLARRWSLSIDEPFDTSCAWVAPAVRASGTQAVLKISMPHMEAEHEIEGLRVWAGDPTVRLLEADDDLGAMLLERCTPGTSLRSVSEPEQDQVIAGLLRRLWRVPPAPNVFRPLSLMTAHWCEETRADSARWRDAALVEDGLRVFEELCAGGDDGVLLATDLHAGNVLRAQHEPWLVIDPKPFIGDPAYDATQHLLNCKPRVHADPRGTVTRFAELLEVDSERVRLWLFARLAAEPRDTWEANAVALARLLRS
jgi:streptomycin 6-kinase